jgi:hypothetical protein
MRIARNKMDKKYSVLIILITFAVFLNIVVLGALVPQHSAQNGLNISYIDKPISKVIANVIPLNLEINSSTPSKDINISSVLQNRDKLVITKMQTNLIEGSFLVFISNVDDSLVTITDVFVNECSANLTKDLTIPENSKIILMITLPDGIVFARTYEIRLLSSEDQSTLFYEIVC